MASATINIGKAQLDLVTLSNQANEQYADTTDIAVKLNKMGLPLEINTRLMDLWSVTKNVAGQVIHIGKIIIMKILEFIQKYPNTTMGVAIGIAIGALVSLIPFVGPLLAPLATAVGVVFFGLKGYALDKHNNKDIFDNFIEAAHEAAKNLYDLAREFFQYLADLFNTLREKWELDKLFALK